MHFVFLKYAPTYYFPPYFCPLMNIKIFLNINIIGRGIINVFYFCDLPIPN